MFKSEKVEIVRRHKSLYGFCANPELNPHENAKEIIKNTPMQEYFNTISNMESQTLCYFHNKSLY